MPEQWVSAPLEDRPLAQASFVPPELHLHGTFSIKTFFVSIKLHILILSTTVQQWCLHTETGIHTTCDFNLTIPYVTVYWNSRLCTHQCGVKAFVKLLAYSSEVTGWLSLYSTVRINQLLTLQQKPKHQLIICHSIIFDSLKKESRLSYLWASNKVLGEGWWKQASEHLFHPGPELNVEQLSPGTGLGHTAWPTWIHYTLWQAGQDLIQLIWNYFT